MSSARSLGQVFTAPQMREGGGFIVRRSVGSQNLNVLDPFLMLDHLGPAHYGPGEAVGAPDHPHRGFETVTYILKGGVHHQDSVGNQGSLTSGWVQWMTAGSGVVHSEMPTDELLKNGGEMEGFQLWVNLPAKDKMIAPRYQDTPPERIPKVHINNDNGGRVVVSVIAGETLGSKAVIETRTPMLYYDILASKGGTVQVDVPTTFNAFIYVYRGHGTVGGQAVAIGQYAQLSTQGDTLALQADDEAGEFGCLVIGGQPLHEPVARYGPFVMNTQEEIQQAFLDYQSGKFGQIAGSDERYAMTKSAVNQQKESGRWSKDDL